MSIQHIDHIIYAAHDLDAATDHIESLFGVRPIFGGQHSGRGTHNALLSLGDRIYLEIIAPDPTQPEPPQARSFNIDNLDTPRLVTWAAGSERLDEQCAAARAAGYDPGVIVDGGRLTPDGVQLKWRSAKNLQELAGKGMIGDGLVPFLIAWGDTPHPATKTPKGCTLLSITATHPNPVPIRAMLTALQTPLTVEQGDQIQFVAKVETPNGVVELK